MKPALLILMFFAAALFAEAQVPDSTASASDTARHNKAVNKAIYGEARKAAIMSAIIPGLGQAYNRKFWKIPLIYGGIGGLSYIFATNHKEFTYYRTNLRAAADNDSTTINITPYTIDQLQAQKLYYKKFRDFAAIGIGLIYLINIIDANVDAHLKTFDVSDDLGIVIDPYQSLIITGNGIRTACGISIKINFK